MRACTNITEAEFTELASPFEGQAVASVWLGDYTALYIEIGDVVGSYTDSGRPKAKYCAYLGFDWELKADDEALLTSAEPGAKANIAELLQSRRIAEVVATSSLELELRLDPDARLISVTKAGESPEWTLFLPSGGCLASEASSLVIEAERGPVGASRAVQQAGEDGR